MFNLLALGVYIQSLLSLIIGAIVLSRDPSKSLYRWFFATCLISSVWIISGFFGGNINNDVLSRLLLRADYIFGAFLVFSYWSFSIEHFRSVISSTHKVPVAANISRFIGFILASIAALSTYIDEVVSIQGRGNMAQAREGGYFIFLYGIPVLFFVIFGAYNLFSAKINAKGDNQNRANIVFYGLIIPAVMVGIPFLILDTFSDQTSDITYYQQIGYFGFTVFIFLNAYGMVKHNLFSFRANLLHTVANRFFDIGLFVLVLYLFYFAYFELFHLLFGTDSMYEYAIVFGYILLITFIFKPAYELCDKISNKLIRNQNFDEKSTLNELSTILATELDLVTVIRKSSILLNNTIQPSFIRFVVFDANHSIFYDFGTEGSPKNNLVYDDLYDEKKPILQIRDQNNSKSRDDFRKIKGEAVLRLYDRDELVGAIILGPKKNGVTYNKQDQTLLNISEKELSIAIQNARYFEEIQKFNVTLQRKVNQATKSLEHSNEKLRALDEAKDEFISMASHQLRTPLTSIKGYISMILDGDAGKITKQQRKLLEEAFGSSQRMVYLIADLLNVSRLKTGKFIIEKNTANLAEIVEEEVRQLIPTAKARNLELNYKKPSRFPEMEFDITKTRQVAMNFIDNAIYYTPQGGKIDVILKSTKDYIEFKVVDNGIGVPKEMQHKLFSKFYRADNAQKARPDGTGLGLFMAKKVITAQGGQIIFKSEEGKGSTFGFKLKR
jgi:signal transduction histidine kinase